MKTSASVLIDRPIAEVFELTTGHVSEWSNIVVKEETLSETPEVVGTTFHSVTEDRGNQMEFEGVITAFDPPHRSAVAMKGSMFDLTADYTFEDLGIHTRVTQSSTVQGKGLFQVMLVLGGIFMKRASCRALQQELDSLKHFCEGYAAQTHSNKCDS